MKKCKTCSKPTLQGWDMCSECQHKPGTAQVSGWLADAFGMRDLPNTAVKDDKFLDDHFQIVVVKS
jgi:hypothetical protein